MDSGFIITITAHQSQVIGICESRNLFIHITTLLRYYILEILNIPLDCTTRRSVVSIEPLEDKAGALGIYITLPIHAQYNITNPQQ